MAKLPAFAAAAEYLYCDCGLIPVLYSMEQKNDFPIAQAVAARLRCPHLVLQAGDNAGEILTLVRRMSLVISMRLHVLVFASGQGVPLVGIVYDPKVSAFTLSGKISAIFAILQTKTRRFSAACWTRTSFRTCREEFS